MSIFFPSGGDDKEFHDNYFYFPMWAQRDFQRLFSLWETEMSSFLVKFYKAPNLPANAFAAPFRNAPTFEPEHLRSSSEKRKNCHVATNAAVVHLLWAVEEVSALRQAVERSMEAHRIVSGWVWLHIAHFAAFPPG